MSVQRFSLGLLVGTLAWTATAGAHPHVFSEAKLEVVAAADGSVEALRHVWRFDELFSSTVLLEFDANTDNQLDDSELEKVADTVTRSIAEFNYFQIIVVEGKEIAVSPVTDMIADMVDNQLILFFTSQPAETVSLSSNPAFAVYDPTFYTAIEFMDDASMALLNAPEGCTHKMVVPDADEAIAQNQDTLTEAFYTESDGNDLSKIFATRMEVTCIAQ